MKISDALKSVAAGALPVVAGAASAHEDHGLPGSHGHATDSFRFVAWVARTIGCFRSGKK